MPNTDGPATRRVLDPISRISEILFGLIMALTFTGSLSAVTAGRDEVRTMLIGAIGCNIAWGLIDGVMYLLTSLTERARNLSAVRAAREASEPAQAHRAIADALPPQVASILQSAELESMRVRLQQLRELPDRARLHREDYRNALGVFLLVVAATFPVVVPFMVISESATAMRVSNGVAVVMLFLCGFRLGQYSQHKPWWMGVAMAVIGAALVALTIALGG